jgi:hypothetical protein
MAGGEERVPHLQKHRTEDLKPNKGSSETPMFHVLHSIDRKIIYRFILLCFFGWENFEIGKGEKKWMRSL